MKFTSTRDASKLYTFEEALLSGYAPDGGLFVPQSLPQIDVGTTLHGQWLHLNYVDLAVEVLYPFFEDDIPRSDLQQLMQQALSGFDKDPSDLVPVVPLVAKVDDNNKAQDICHNIYVAELFHGPTFCFKDFGLRVTIQLLNYFAAKRNVNVTLVVSTTGDTGPAAVQAVEDCASPHLGILVHFPQGQISDFQRKQLTTSTSSRVKIVAFQGGGDDMDGPIKNIMTKNNKKKFSSVHDRKDRIICGVNSYNIGRPLMQMVHFLWTYLRVVEMLQSREDGSIPEDFRLDVVIPTGAMGNMAGCYMAKNMGVPLGTLCAGVNINDITNIVFTTGLIQRTEQAMKKTLSDAINIQLPYNMERLLFYLTEQNHDQVREWYSQLEGSDRCCQIHTNQRWWAKLQSEFRSARIQDEELCATMKAVLEAYEYWADPHTCVAFATAKQLGYYGHLSRPVAIMATAAPCKFQEAVTTALGQEKWEEYEREHFPSRGKTLNKLEERPPTIYVADPGKTLAQNQMVWEAMTIDLIEQLG